MAVQKADYIHRDFEVDGVSASGFHKVIPREQRVWGTWVEGVINAGLSNGGLVYDTRASMDADKAHPANSSAWVVGDPQPAYNGIWRKLGASGAGSWARIADLPYNVVNAQNDGSGTANAVVASSSAVVSTHSYSQLISVPFTVANTGTMTISINGETPRRLVTNTGAAVPSGYIKAGMAALVMVDDLARYRLFSYGDASAIQAAAEAAASSSWAGAAAAEVARDAAIGAVPTVFVETLADLKAVNSSTHHAVYLKQDGFQGQFFWKSGDFSARAPREPYDIVKANDALLTSGAWIRDSASWGRTIIIFATGQSNIQNHPVYNWTPPPNLFYWSADSGIPGTWYETPDTHEITVALAYGANVAQAHPRDRVIVVSIGRGSTKIENWLPGAPVVDMFAGCKAAVEACLAATGETRVHEFLWWQGESDWFADKGATYVADWEAVYTRFRGETWFPADTPVTIFAVSPFYTSDLTMGRLNNLLKQIVRRDPQIRTFVDTTNLSPANWEAGALHFNGLGCDVGGRMAYMSRHSGAGILATGEPRMMVVKRRHETRTQAVTLVNDEDLRVGLRSGGGFYRIRGSLWFQADAAPDVKFGFSGPPAIVINSVYKIIMAQTGTAEATQMTVGSYPTNIPIVQTGLYSRVEFDFLIGAPSSDGIFAVQWAQNTSHANFARLWAGSYIELTEI